MKVRNRSRRLRSAFVLALTVGAIMAPSAQTVGGPAVSGQLANSGQAAAGEVGAETPPASYDPTASAMTPEVEAAIARLRERAANSDQPAARATPGSENGFEWRDAAIGFGVAAVIACIVAGALIAARRHGKLATLR